MNFDLLYTDKKPYKLTKKEKDKLIESLFNLKYNTDKKIELYLYENWNKLFEPYENYIHLKYVKNHILYVDISSKAVFQDIVFLISKINHIMKLSIGETIKTIKIVPLQHLKNQKIFVHNLDHNLEYNIDKRNLTLRQNQNIKENQSTNLTFIEEIKSILLRNNL